MPALAQTDPTLAESSPQSAEPAEPDEIIVTATRREERLRDVPGSISALSGEQLKAIGAQNYADYLARLPGVAFSDGTSGLSTAVIRGIGTTAGFDQGQGTTGYFINDVPLTEPGYATSVPDIDAFDVNRVEVLRGPAGTLFGSASLGGAINFIANTADVKGFHTAAEGILSGTRNAASDINYATKLMLNVPLIDDKLAVRFVYTRRKSAGYLDNIGLGKNGSNDLSTQGWRGSILYTPKSSTTITYFGLYQTNDTDDASIRYSDLGKYTRSTSVHESNRLSTQLHNLRIDQDIGFATLTATAAYVRKTNSSVSDYTLLYGSFAGNLPQSYNGLYESKTTDYELRLASPKGNTFEWLIGAMHSHVDKSLTDYLSGPNATSIVQANRVTAGQPLYDTSLFVRHDGQDAYYHGFASTKGNESAIYGEANLNFLTLMALTAGGRLFRTDSSTRTAYYGVFYGVGGALSQTYSINQTGFAPKVSLTYRNEGLMIYALGSKGFRFGSPNTIFPLAGFNTPAGTTSDSLWNYEIGTHLDLLNRKVRLDVTGYFVDWKNLQLRLLRPDGFTYGANAGAAHIYGIDATVHVRPTQALTFTSNVTYLDAKISEGSTSAGITKGQRLPTSAKWRISNALSYDLGGPLSPTLAVLHRYVSSSPGYLSQPIVFGAYNVFDARFGIHKGSYSVTAFVENIGNRDAVTFGYGNALGHNWEYIIRPRTFGLQFDWSI